MKMHIIESFTPASCALDQIHALGYSSVGVCIHQDNRWTQTEMDWHRDLVSQAQKLGICPNLIILNPLTFINLKYLLLSARNCGYKNVDFLWSFKKDFTSSAVDVHEALEYAKSSIPQFGQTLQLRHLLYLDSSDLDVEKICLIFKSLPFDGYLPSQTAFFTLRHVIRLHHTLDALSARGLRPKLAEEYCLWPSLADPNHLPQFYGPLWKVISIDNNESKLFAPQISFVIPFYQRVHSVQLTLRALTQITDSNFEVILVNDGSFDTFGRPLSHESLLAQLQPKSSLPVKFVHLTRAQPREPGDFAYRPALARNIGARHARAPYVVFLDPDTLLNENFVYEALNLFKTHEVIMPKRNRALSPELLGQTQPKSPAWDFFYNDPLPWNERPTPWRWASTCCLGVQLDNFWQVGGFRESYCMYGFEDTDLAYRLWRRGAKFSLMNSTVIQVDNQPEDSDYFGDDDIKTLCLERAAPFFYIQHCTPEAFSALEPYITSHSSI